MILRLLLLAALVVAPTAAAQMGQASLQLAFTDVPMLQPGGAPGPLSVTATVTLPSNIASGPAYADGENLEVGVAFECEASGMEVEGPATILVPMEAFDIGQTSTYSASADFDVHGTKTGPGLRVLQCMARATLPDGTTYVGTTTSQPFIVTQDYAASLTQDGEARVEAIDGRLTIVVPITCNCNAETDVQVVGAEGLETSEWPAVAKGRYNPVTDGTDMEVYLYAEGLEGREFTLRLAPVATIDPAKQGDIVAVDVAMPGGGWAAPGPALPLLLVVVACAAWASRRQLAG